MKNILMLALWSKLLYSFPAIQTITCDDGQNALMMNLDSNANTMSFRYSLNGDVVLFDDLLPQEKNDIPKVYVSNDILADGNRYYDLMISMERPVWVETHTESFITRSGQIIEYIVPAHYENTLIKWLNILLREIDGRYVFSRVEGDDFGFTTDHPIAPGTLCIVK